MVVLALAHTISVLTIAMVNVLTIAMVNAIYTLDKFQATHQLHQGATRKVQQWLFSSIPLFL